MMVAEESSPSDAGAKSVEAARRRQHQVNLISMHMAMNVLGLCVCLTPRPKLLAAVSGLEPGSAAQLLATFSSVAGIVEFVLNPITGKLSDALGRKAFLLQAPIVSCLCKLLVFVRPSKFTLSFERCVSGACTTIGGSTACAAALADMIEDQEELARGYAQLGAAAGLGVIVGPMIGATAMGAQGNTRRPFLAGALMSFVQVFLVQAAIKETLAPKLRKQLTSFTELLASISPFSFLQLFTHGSVVARLVSIASLQCFCEGKSISDLNAYYLLNDAKFSDSWRSFYLSCFGFVMTLSGIIGRKTIERLGMRGHTTFQNVASVLGFILMGSSGSSKLLIFSALPIYAFAMERRAAVSSSAVKAAADAGMGKGEFSAAFANLRAIAVGIAPLLYARVYKAGLAAQPPAPGRPYFAAALIAVIAELIHRTIRNCQLQF